MSHIAHCALSVTKMYSYVQYIYIRLQFSVAQALVFPGTARPYSSYIVLTCTGGVNNNELDVAHALRLVI